MRRIPPAPPAPSIGGDILAMKKLLKVLVGFIVVLLVLIGAATVALRTYLPPEKAKALVVERLSAQLHRQVEVGSVSVSLLSGLRMTQLKISENPTFAKGTFISSEEFALNVALLPLLSRKVIIRRALLQKPVVNIIRRADGKTFNFSDLTETAQPVAAPKTPAPADRDAPAFALLVGRAEVHEGALHFVDQSPAKQSVDISPFDMKLQNVSLTKPFVAQLSTRLKYKGSDIGLVFGGEANLFSGAFTLSSGEITTGQAKMTLHGALTELKTNTPTFKLHLESNAMPVKDLLKPFPGVLPPTFVLEGSTALSMDVSGSLKHQQFAAQWNGTGLRIAQGQDFEKPAGTPLELSIIGDRAASGLVGLKTITGNLAGNPLTGSGVYDASAKVPAIHLRLKGHNWSLAEIAKLSPTLATSKPTGDLTFDVAVSGPASAPQTTVQAKANVAMPFIKHEYYEGQTLAMHWDLSDITPDLSKINGTASFTQGPGKILQMEKLAAASRIGKIALAPLDILAKLQKKGALKQINLPSLQTVPFDSLEGDYVIKAGTLLIKKFDLAGKDLGVINRGRVGLFGAQPLQMNVALQLAKDAIGGTVGGFLKDASGRPNVKFTVTGSVDSPQVKLDLQDAGQKALEQAGQEILKKNPELQGAVDDIQKSLKGIFH